MQLTKSQKKEIAQRGWEPLNDPIFIGADWYDKGENVTVQMAEVSEVIAELQGKCEGVDFLIVAFRTNENTPAD